MPASISNGYKLYEQPFPSGDYTFTQLAFVVDDLVATARRWVDLYGVGPFYVLPSGSHEGIYQGEPVTVLSQIAVSQAGPLQIELIQPLEDGPSVYRDFRRAGAGTHHIATITKDYDRAIAHYERLGFAPAMALRTPGGRVAYIDTSADVGLYTEIIEESADFVRALRGTARACAGWDGADPIRHLGGAEAPAAGAAL